MKVCIDPGHGGRDSGALFQQIKEKDVNLAVALHVIDHLDREIDYVLTRDDDIFLSLQERCDVANLYEADIFVSIHCNADPDFDEVGMPEARGEEIWYYKNSSEGLRLAKCLIEGVDKIFPNEPFRGIKATDVFYVLKHTNMPAVLIEMGFIDKSSSAETFSNERTLHRIGKLIADGIEEYLDDHSW